MALNEHEKKSLLEIARGAIEAYLLKRPAAAEINASGGLGEDSGAFVTIYMGERLRGCIGTFASPNPLYKTVSDMAVAAAVNDPRFAPLRADELSSVRIEISVLSPLKEVSGPSEIQVGRHGIYIIKGSQRGVLLPQVAVEHGWGVGEFLENTCLKAGLGPDDWKTGAVIFTFEAEIIKGP